MGDDFTNSVLMRVVAKICQAIGFSKTQPSALEVLTSIMIEHLKTLCKGAHRCSELAGRTEPTLSDVSMIFKELRIELHELKEYVDKVGEIPPPVDVPKYPIEMPNHLNFLRPGSIEVITRPLHIHEYMPAQFPEQEARMVSLPKENYLKESPKSNLKIVKYSHTKSPTSKKSRRSSTVGRPLREVKSVLMTRSGFLSSSYEGKLPETSPVKVVDNFDSDEEPSVSSCNKLSIFKKLPQCSKDKKDRHVRFSLNNNPIIVHNKSGKQIDKVMKSKMMRNSKKIDVDSKLLDRNLYKLVSPGINSNSIEPNPFASSTKTTQSSFQKQ